MTKRNSKGFTLIEAALVLGIAGMIFLMVFMALPQMLRSRRDTERKSDVMYFVEMLQAFQANNRGALPSGLMSGSRVEKRPSDIERNSGVYSGKDTYWDAFYHDYFDDDFMDPNGEAYQIEPVQCRDSDPKDGQCDYDTGLSVDYTLHVFTQATCSEDKAILSPNTRNFAVMYRTESSGIYCFNNN